jgi:FkbM family methyltransferase
MENQEVDGFSFAPFDNGLEEMYWAANRHLVHYDGPFDVVVDIGAHVGCFALASARKGAGLVLAFEPNPLNFELLVHNIVNNGWWGTVIPLPLAVVGMGYEGQRILKCFFDGFSAQSSFVTPCPHDMRVWTQSIGSVIESLEYIDYMKVDIEGAEYEVFARIDAVKKILSKVRYIDLEIHKLHETYDMSTFNTYSHNGLCYQELVDFMREVGFKGMPHPKVLEEHGPFAFASYNDHFSGHSE